MFLTHKTQKLRKSEEIFPQNNGFSWFHATDTENEFRTGLSRVARLDNELYDRLRRTTRFTLENSGERVCLVDTGHALFTTVLSYGSGDDDVAYRIRGYRPGSHAQGD